MVISGVWYLCLLVPANYKCDSEKIIGVPTKEEIAMDVSGCALCISIMVESVNNIIMSQ
jgi:hypothetical protein